MKYLPKALIANFVLFSAAMLSADYNSNYPAPIHHDGRMPDGSVVYEQNMQSRPANQDWSYDPAISNQWRPTGGNMPQQGEDYNPTTQGSDQPDTRSYDQR